jgi:dimethylglycine dehydrogenase
MGLRDFGGYAFNSLRMEKMYRAWGSEFTEEISGIEAGMERFVDINREFIGSENIKKRIKNDLDVVLVYLVFDDDIQSECYGNEAVFNGENVIGLTTSGAYGFRIKKSLAFAYINPAFANEGQKLKVLTTAGIRLCHIEISAAYDPENEKLRA